VAGLRAQVGELQGKLGVALLSLEITRERSQRMGELGTEVQKMQQVMGGWRGLGAGGVIVRPRMADGRGPGRQMLQGVCVSALPGRRSGMQCGTCHVGGAPCNTMAGELYC